MLVVYARPPEGERADFMVMLGPAPLWERIRHVVPLRV
jgi:hypothetical protein